MMNVSDIIIIIVVIIIIILAIALIYYLITGKLITEIIIGEVNLINKGTKDYIEVTKSTARPENIKVVYYAQTTQGLSGSETTISNFNYWINSWNQQGIINITQRNNAQKQFDKLGLI